MGAHNAHFCDTDLADVIIIIQEGDNILVEIICLHTLVAGKGQQAECLWRVFEVSK